MWISCILRTQLWEISNMIQNCTHLKRLSLSQLNLSPIVIFQFRILLCVKSIIPQISIKYWKYLLRKLGKLNWNKIKKTYSSLSLSLDFRQIFYVGFLEVKINIKSLSAQRHEHFIFFQDSPIFVVSQLWKPKICKQLIDQISTHRLQEEWVEFERVIYVSAAFWSIMGSCFKIL